ncbi:MAG TPA: hypothetical protein DD671_14380 [Balneolaceae bacterium]|nr:hypothetical protein [Balneola sp.]HBQ60763.1 hypothetical protein [Balneolaceae bacterium]|tara:strand:+ start:6700 stop:7407 length:708 start_codon:yes stop_codon:yes gene_type:complete
MLQLYKSKQNQIMKNKGLKITGIILALLIGGFVLFTLSIDGMVKSGIEESGSELMQTVVKVDAVSISLFSGNGSITGFTVQNPDGFGDEPALYIQEASLKLDIWSLFSDQIIINEVIVKSPKLSFEQKGFGANLKTLNDNMDLSSKGSSETTLIIDYLLIEDGRVEVITDLEKERTTEVSLSQFTLTDIGRDGNNTVKQSVRQVLEPLLQKAMKEAIKSGVTEQIENKINDLLNN